MNKFDKKMGCHLRRIIVGDFDVTWFTYEAVGGVQGISSAMNEFDLCINNANLVDLVFTGVQFTWCNKRDNGKHY